MKKLILLLGLAVSLTSTMTAAPCTMTSLQGYLALGSTGCTIGSTTFADFTLISGQSFATPIAAAAIAITPVTNFSMPGLQLTFNQAAGAGDLYESFFRYSARGSLTGASIVLGASTAAGDGAVTATADLCPGGSFSGGLPQGCGTTPATLITLRTATDLFSSDQALFSAVSFLDVFVDVAVDGGPTGRASLGSVTTLVQAPQGVPEPSTAMLTVAGFCVAALWRRTRQFQLTKDRT